MDEVGRRARFEAVFGEVYEPLQRYLRRRCAAGDVDDVLNDTLATVWPLRRIDPAPSIVPVDLPTSPSARASLERTMQTPLPTTDPSTETHPTARRRHRLLLAAAVLIAVAGGAAIFVSGGDDDTTDVGSGPPLELSLGAGDSLASCVAFDVPTLAQAPLAFGGTATEVGDDTVTLEVDRWYRGGDADVVELHAEGGQAALIAGFEFVEGERYLVSGDRGTVSFCGFSGPATPQFESFYEDAFGD